VRRSAEVDSTNRVALDLARSGAPEGVVVAACSQTAGRGRRGRTWDAAPGSALLVSVLLRPASGAAPLHLAVAGVSLAAADACEAVAGFRPGLKWPNDLVVGDRKLAGVLAEVAGDAVVVGVGLNVASAAPWPPGAVAAEEVAGRSVAVDRLLDAFLAALGGRYPPGDWAAVASEYRRACTTIGRVVRVDLPDGSFTGAAADVSDDGRLLVDVGTCRRAVEAADVVHLRPTPAPD
jgi:BirA family transcriptional regulator, biotin operon repressor / biotin---[acetyl-CoA-carboxylase] ligase